MGLIILLLTILVLGVVIMIEKTKLEFKFQKILIVAASIFLSVTLLIQKLREPPIENPQNIEIFYLPGLNKFPVDIYKFPQLNGTNEIVEYLLEKTLGPYFLLIEGESFSGKTYSICKYLEKTPTYYIDLRINNVTRLNMKVKSEVLVFDHAEILQDINIFKTLVQLYMDEDIKVIIITNSPVTKQLFIKDGYEKYIKIKKFRRDHLQSRYLLRQIYEVQQDEDIKQRMNIEYFNICLKWMDVRMDFINDFLGQQDYSL